MLLLMQNSLKVIILQSTLEEYAKKVELPTVPTKVSELQNDSEFIVKSVYDEKIAALEARIAALEAKHPEATE
mgnify:CR=1 FL=1